MEWSRFGPTAMLTWLIPRILFGAVTEPQVEHPRAVTLDEAIAYARTHQPSLRAALARVDAARAAAEVPRARWLPTIGASAELLGATANNTTASTLSPGSLDLPRVGGTRVVKSGGLRPYASTFVGLGARQEVFDFGRIAAQAAAADALADVEQQRARGASLDLGFDVEEAYFAVFAAKSIEQASEEAYERSRVHRDLARAGVEAGLRPPIELTRAEAELVKFELGRVKARGNVAVAQVALAAAVGSPEPALDAVSSPTPSTETPDLTAAIVHASANDPGILAAIGRLRAQRAVTRAIGAELRPELWLTGTISGRAGGALPSGNGDRSAAHGWLPEVPNWDLGLVLNWPLYSGIVRARVHASRAHEEVLKEELASVKLDQVAAIRRAHVALEVARAALPGLRESVEAARANYTQADARFRAGLGTSVELADAEDVRAAAEIQLALGEFELVRARAAFGRAIAEGA